MTNTVRFKARARALDMLGRQQIAGIPTAINELFKNAHDAYADVVVAEYFPTRRLLALGDDGVGMSRVDFEQRWMALGTESKVRVVGADGEISAPSTTVPKGRTVRPTMGEKGIGRLAIAVLGPQVLIVTRAHRGSQPGAVTVAFINWSLFEIPGLDLEDVVIPIKTIESGILPNQQDVEELVEGVRANVVGLSKRMGQAAQNRILDELNNFKLDPSALEGGLKLPNVEKKSSGTRFYISPTNPNLDDDVVAEDEDSASRIQGFLLGFMNTMLPGHPKPTLATSFLYHPSTLEQIDLIAAQEFWRPDEFERADHRLIGRFDEYGNFSGVVSVYGEIIEAKFDKKKGVPTRTACGPFSIDLAYVQGRGQESLIPPEEYARIEQKLKRIGGVYIYKDNIRVLPYGLSNYDWLEIEKNRSKRAAYYYFSYRRMFGAITIDSEDNSELQEKAGREGFRENTAYREFRRILKRFFVEAAAEFFREDSDQGGLFNQTRKRLNQEADTKKQAEKYTSEERIKFKEKLDKFFEGSENGKYRLAVEKIVKSTQSALDKVVEEAPARIADAISAIESEAEHSLDQLLKEIALTPPAGVGLTNTLRKSFTAYERERTYLETVIVQPALANIRSIATETAHLAQVVLDRRERLSRTTESILKQLRVDAATNKDELRAAVHILSVDLDKINSQLIKQISILNTDLQNTLSNTDLPESEMMTKVREIEKSASVLADLAHINHEVALRQVATSVRGIDENGRVIGSVEALGILEEEVLALRDKVAADLELVQLGSAVAVINHEFQSSVNSIRSNISSLQKFEKTNRFLGEIYRNLHTSFDHLDNYLTLFTPLHRRLYRESVDISGGTIYQYLNEIFVARLKESNVKFTATPEFNKFQFHGYPSTFYPVFVNLIDNAIHWAASQKNAGEIVLDSDGEKVLIRDNGPGINPKDLDIIFDYGFSRKVGGRGLGLYIAREVLKTAGFDITSRRPEGKDTGAIFEISPIVEASVQP